MRKFLLILMLVFITLPLFAKDMLVEIDVHNRNNFKTIYRGKFDIVDRQGTVFTLYIKDKQLDELKSLGFSPKVLIPDIQKYTAEGIKRGARIDTSLTGHYHTYAQTVVIMDSIANANSSICKLDTIGYSVNGRLILAMKISDNPNKKEDEAEVRIVGCHHGNEWPSSEIPLYLIAYLTEKYGTDSYITDLVDNREIWIMPIFNPDGHEAQTRHNANDIDLNRNYGYMWTADGGDTKAYGQPETEAMYKWSQRENFTLGLSYHTYHPAVNYVWNYTPNRAADSTMIYQYAQIYGDSTTAHGDSYWVTEGYDWYQTTGDLNDYSYGIDGVDDVTIELCHEFIPDSTELDSTWHINRGAMLATINKAGQGIHGYVIDSVTGDTIKESVINITEIDWPVFSDRETGDYFRDLLPGTYTVEAWANGYREKTISGVQVYSDSGTKLDISLAPDTTADYYAFKLVEADIDNASTPVINAHTSWALGKPDGKYVPLNNNGQIVLDMGQNTPILGNFTVFEGDDGTSNETYKVYASNTFNGPWTFIADGSGTETFSISGSGLSSARYIKIKDSGSNASSGSTAGFDLDAIENIKTNGPIAIILKDSLDDTGGDGKLDAGESASLYLMLKNVGTDTLKNCTAILTTNSAYISIFDSTCNYGYIAAGDSTYGNDYYTISASDSTPSQYEINFSLIVTGESYTDTLIYSLTTGGHSDYLVLDLDPDHSSGPVIDSILKALNYNGSYTTTFDSTVFPNYSSIFVCTGIYSNNAHIDNTEGNALHNYLVNDSGRLYIEGGDVWYYDPSQGYYDFCPDFGINATSDGNSDLATIGGITGTFTAGMSFSYSGENSWIDHIDPTGGGFVIFDNSSPAYNCGIANDAGIYKTVGVSFEFGGLTDGSNNSTKSALADSIMHFFLGNTGLRNNTAYSLANGKELFNVKNHFSNKLNILFVSPITSGAKLKIYNVTGRKMLSKDLNIRKGINKFSLNTKLHTGVYFIYLKSNNKEFKRKIFIIE